MKYSLGLTEEVSKKRSRRTVKHQRGIVGASLADIAAKRTQAPAARLADRQAAITKAKAVKKEKEAKKPKVYNKRWMHMLYLLTKVSCKGCSTNYQHSTKGIETAEGDQGRTGRTLIYLSSSYYHLSMSIPCPRFRALSAMYCTLKENVKPECNYSQSQRILTELIYIHRYLIFSNMEDEVL